MDVDADLHLHSPHAGGVSDKMTLPVMAEQAAIKGLDLVGTGDILHPGWRDHVRTHTTDTGNGIYLVDDTAFLATAEVEDERRVHHLLLFPSLEAADDVHAALAAHSRDIDREGRPHLQMTGEDIAHVCETYGVLIGPAHAFTPWTSIYKEYDSLRGCYGDSMEYLCFLELGLSADSAMADQIRAHHDLGLVSFSDAHSPWPHRLGREFTRFKMTELSFDALRTALSQGADGGITMNAGFDPREGKYHCTACIDCYQSYALEQARQRDWTCDVCGKRIKKGVKDRISELTDADGRPGGRPPYLHLVPLAEIIQHVVGHASPTTKTVQDLYGRFQDRFASEITMLTETPIADLKAVHPGVGRAVAAFRADEALMVPGGGGKYGELIIPGSAHEAAQIRERRKSEFQCRYVEEQTGLDAFDQRD